MGSSGGSWGGTGLASSLAFAPRSPMRKTARSPSPRPRLRCTVVSAALLLCACSDYSLSGKDEPGDSAGADDGGPALPDILVGPATWDFGTLDTGTSATLEIGVQNVGDAILAVYDLAYTASSRELRFDARVGANGSPPWRLAPGDRALVEVAYAPSDGATDSGVLQVSSNDPDEPVAEATQVGNGRPFEDFYTGWYVYDDGVPYETTSNPSYQVDHHGDADLYWYEPSGAHGLLGSSDPVSDFAIMRQYVLDRAGPPVVPTGPFSYDADSDLATFELATFTYFMCDFWLDATDDPARYQISSGTVDDGIQVMVNGAILGRIALGESGSWPLNNAVPGQVNTLIIILVDDSRVDKYVSDLAFYRDGVMVTE